MNNEEIFDTEIDKLKSEVPVRTTAALNATEHSAQSTFTAVRLPKIELPTFSGNILDWEGFRDRNLMHWCILARL